MKKITIEHLARVEGNGGISATIDGKTITSVKFTVCEGPRLVERLTLGKTPEEDASIVPRICAICTLSHKYAAIKAMESALSIRVPPKVTLLRELMHLGEIIESHSLHIYYLSLPDYVGFPSLVAMAPHFEQEARIALEMKEFANFIMKTASGRYIHGENPVIGGFGKFPTTRELIRIKNKAIQFMPSVLKTISIFCELDYPDCPEEETVYACCLPKKNVYGFNGDKIILSTEEIIDADDYKNLTNEYVVPHSFAKRSLYKGKPYSVGALARVNNLGERLRGETGRMFKKYFSPRWKTNPLYHNAAQALEILYCFERIPKVADAILKHKQDPSIVDYKATEGRGTGIVEAPRGLLIHHYEITKGLVSACDIITPTSQNAEDIERYCYIAAQTLLDRNEEEKIRDRMDIVVRAFDPCISCSVHTAQVKKAPSNEWKTGLTRLTEKENPIFIGIGNTDQADDGLGLELALQLKKQGIKDVWLESELTERTTPWKESSSRLFLFFDALDCNEKPGKIMLLPLNHVLSNDAISHKFQHFLPSQASYQQLKQSYVLGIQPEVVQKGKKISPPVQNAMESVLHHLLHYWRQ